MVHLLGFVGLRLLQHVFGDVYFFEEGGWDGPGFLLRSVVALQTIHFYEHAVEVHHAWDDKFVDDDTLARHELLPHVAKEHHWRLKNESVFVERLNLMLRIAYQELEACRHLLFFR